MRRIIMALGVVTVTLGLLIGVPGPSRGAKLATSELLGVWTGQWTDTTLGTSGTVLFDINRFPAPDGAGMQFAFRFEGPFFGCAEGGPQNAYIFPGGTKESKVTPRKIKANSDDGTFGKYRLKTKGTIFRIRGTNACDGAGPSSYSAKGQVNGTAFTATFTIKVDGGTDTVTLALNRVTAN